MTEEEKLAQQKEEEKKARQKEIKNSITEHIIEIKTRADSFSALLAGKEIFTEEKLDAAFEFNDSIEEKLHDITALLFDLRDNL